MVRSSIVSCLKFTEFFLSYGSKLISILIIFSQESAFKLHVWLQHQREDGVMADENILADSLVASDCEQRRGPN